VLPTITYPAELPVSGQREEIARAIRDHQVVIVAARHRLRQDHAAAEDLPRARPGARAIGHTQPRRIAARTSPSASPRSSASARRTVGYQVRFTDRVERHARQGDDRRHPARRDPARPRAAPYDTIIIDEAHERSLNIDFLLGYLKQLLPRRPTSR
jgi:ATP-dependent helicase HrpA